LASMWKPRRKPSGRPPRGWATSYYQILCPWVEQNGHKPF
jgi:hypothetical protein